MKNSLEQLLKNIADLVKVKTIITFLIVAAFCYLSICGFINEEYFTSITTMVIAFYFGTQYNK